MHRGYANPQKEIQRLARICDRFRDENNALRTDLEAVAVALEKIRDLRRYSLSQGIVIDEFPDALLKAIEVDPIVREALARDGVKAVLEEKDG